MNALDNLAHVLEHGGQEIFVEESVRVEAMKPLQRMLDFSAELKRARGG